MSNLNVFDDEVSGYTPLERPSTLLNSAQINISGADGTKFEDAESADTSSTSDEIPVRKKRQQKDVPFSKNSDKRKKYGAWVKCAEEDFLTCLTDFSITSNRNVETYNYRLARRQHFKSEKGQKQVKQASDMEGVAETKQNLIRDHRLLKSSVPRLKCHKRKKNCDKESYSKILPELDVENQETTVDDVAKKIAEYLQEPKTDLIYKLVKCLGIERAAELYEKTRSVELKGGEMTQGGDKRRTSGGIYISLVKESKYLPAEDIRRVFAEEKRREKRREIMKKRRKRRNKKGKSRGNGGSAQSGNVISS